jgi:hypothetical protein
MMVAEGIFPPEQPCDFQVIGWNFIFLSLLEYEELHDLPVLYDPHV